MEKVAFQLNLKDGADLGVQVWNRSEGKAFWVRVSEQRLDNTKAFVPALARL